LAARVGGERPALGGRSPPRRRSLASWRHDAGERRPRIRPIDAGR